MTDDDKKKPSEKGRGPSHRAGGAGRPAHGKPGKSAPKRPASAAAGKSFSKRSDGERDTGKPFVRRERPEGEGKPRFERRGDSDGAARPPRKPFVKRADGDRKPFARSERPSPEGEGKPRFERRGDSDGAARPPRKPFVKRADGDRKPFTRSERPSPEGEGRPRADERRPASAAGDPAEAGFGDRAMRPGRRERFGEDRPADRGEGALAKPRFERARPENPRDTGDRAPRAGRDSGRKPFARRPAEAELVEGERIAKRLARVGIASRRDAEELIAAGRVRVNGRVLETPAFNVTAEDVIELDGTVLPPIERTRLFLFHKPAGVVTTNRDPEGRQTVFDVLPQDLPRVITVGRLDINTEGLLLLTNDGGLARTLELPATGWLVGSPGTELEFAL